MKHDGPIKSGVASQIALGFAIMDQNEKFECARHGEPLIVADFSPHLVLPYLFRCRIRYEISLSGCLVGGNVPGSPPFPGPEPLFRRLDSVRDVGALV